MFESLKYIKKKFPYFLNMAEDSNNHKIACLLDEVYIDDCNSLEKIRDGYYYLHHKDILELDQPAVCGFENTLVFRTASLNSGDCVSFTSKLFGDLGTTLLVDDDIGDFMEHINIIGDFVRVVADDIKSVTINDEVVAEFGYDEHVSLYEDNISDECTITVLTWNEYTYTTNTNEYNKDIDSISNTLSGATRRNYINLDKTVSVDCIVNTLTGDDNNDGVTMPIKSLTQAIHNRTIGFIGYADSLSLVILNDTTIIGSGEQSKLNNISFWIEPGAKLTLENIMLGDTLTSFNSVGNVSDKSILIKV